jgi:hypothetical protein
MPRKGTRDPIYIIGEKDATRQDIVDTLDELKTSIVDIAGEANQRLKNVHLGVELITGEEVEAD